MATLSDVETALRDLIYQALYPSGSAPSAVGFPVKIYAGWPNPQTLDTDMVETSTDHPTAGHVSIYPLPGERNLTRYPPTRDENPAPAVTYGLSAAGQVITVTGGAPSVYVAQNLCAFVNGKAYVVGATAGETPAQLASALRAAIAADLGGTSVVGAAITLPAGARIGALRVGSTGSSVREVRRQEKQVQVCTWASSPASRAAIDDTFDALLADTPRLALADGSGARLIYRGSREDDFVQKQRIYRRYRIFTVEFATTITEAAAQLVAGVVETDDPQGHPIVTTYS